MRSAYISLFFLAVLLLSSCAQEDVPVNYDPDDLTVSFIASFPEAGTRAAINYKDEKILYDGFQVTAFKPEEAPVGTLKPWGEEFLVKRRKEDGVFRNDSCRWPSNRGKNEGAMQFYALYPTREELRNHLGAAETDFVLKNYSEKTASGAVNYNYRIESFKIAKDISKQADFLAAAKGVTKSDNIYSGVWLNFEHQLSLVDFLAWNSEREYNVEIAAVKICNVMTQGDFRYGPAPYAGKDDNTGGHWEYPAEKYPKDTVEYIYKTGEKLFVIDGNNHTTKQTAESIFGTAGHALLLPCGHKKWNHSSDPTNTAGGLYMTVLLRVQKRDTGVQIYPEPGHKYGSGGVHYYLINKSDSTINQKELKLYVNASGPEGPDRIIEVGDDGKPVYYTDKGCTKKYTPPAGCEVKELSWAAIPLEVNWKPGYRYTYYLDYGKGVGVHDPTDIYNNVAPNVMIVGFDEWLNDKTISNPNTGAYTLTLIVGYR